ncbi:hypothetical protein PTSG_12468 [Salpingoeca rosetta]|uniref:NOD3 protein n=1 Tax=Salpingoeca rosetta (strain ATCC 50818 / BSB-021) TaxID=946362 RepID=F2UFQ5_SALR5|nr:uncharacterized protein PTSG_12468 [Salpingoeca rosetta]EGD75623.1 hypothetical protein PTSG_12468 [Salpingoeca rosetta]|eukprot:XP_004992080.1 hypothetical protein PTSG_12468 [Salpingoeca rosetta]
MTFPSSSTNNLDLHKYTLARSRLRTPPRAPVPPRHYVKHHSSQKYSRERDAETTVAMAPTNTAAVAAVAGNGASNDLLDRINSSTDLDAAAIAAHLDDYTQQRIHDMANSTCGEECILSWHNLEEIGARVIAEALKKNTNMLKLNLGWNNLRAAGGRAIAEALKRNNTLHELSLSDNHLGPDGCAAIATALESNTMLHTLFLYNNNIGTDGVKAIAKSLLKNTSLTRLSLSRNHLGPDGAIAIAEALKSNTTLLNLDLGWNEIGETGAAALARAIDPRRSITITYGGDNKEEEITALEGQLRQTTQQLQSTRDALATSNRTTAVLLLCLVSGAALAYGHYRQHL